MMKKQFILAMIIYVLSEHRLDVTALSIACGYVLRDMLKRVISFQEQISVKKIVFNT